jgi:M6 family metalloprotease-like protein
MKNKYLTLIFTTLLCSTLATAIPPYPGLNLKEPARPRIPNSESLSQQRRISSHHAPKINLAPRGLLILVEFADKQFAEGNSQLAFDSLANSDSYTYNGATGSCKQYFADQSNSQYIPHFDVVGPIALSNDMAYYGADMTTNDDRYLFDFILEACQGADQLGIDFSNYDNDNDGFVDFVYVLYAGYGQADGGEEATIWPHKWDLKSVLYFGYHNQSEYFANSETDYLLPQIDGKILNDYACSSELKYSTNARAGIGTICHEFSHVLGLPDYYLTVTDLETNPNQRLTPGAWSLMGYGNYLNNGNTPPNYSVYDKYFLGWVTPEMLSKSQELTIPADGESYFMLTRNEKHISEGAYRTDTVYYIENRQQEGWDTYLPGYGMLIWQVIFNEEDWYNNCPNDYVPRYRLISALTTSSPYTTSKPKPEVPFPGSKNITEYTPFSHNGLYNIQETSGIITCDFTTTSISSSVENVIIMTSDCWYNILGQPIDPNTYKGVAIYKNEKYLLR